MAKRCNKGKSCGATCIDGREDCLIELPEQISRALTRTRDDLEAKIQNSLDSHLNTYKPVETEQQAIEWLGENYKRMATEGMEDDYYGGPGQRGSIRSKVWLIGQEGYARPDRLYQDKKQQEINDKLSKDPVALTNTLRLHKSLHDTARKEAPKKIVTAGVERYLRNDKFKFEDDATIKEWLKHSGSTYYGKLGKILQGLGFEGSVMGANISSLLQPPGQRGISSIAQMLKSNGVNPKTFAEGAFANNQSWYNYSARQRAPIIKNAIERLKPKLVYMGQQAEPGSTKGFNYLLYNLAKEFKQTPYHLNHDGKDYKWIVVDHGKGKRTVILNGWHPTAIGKQAIRVTDREFLTKLTESLMTTGKTPAGTVAEPIRIDTLNKVLDSK